MHHNYNREVACFQFYFFRMFDKVFKGIKKKKLMTIDFSSILTIIKLFIKNVDILKRQLRHYFGDQGRTEKNISEKFQIFILVLLNLYFKCFFS